MRYAHAGPGNTSTAVVFVHGNPGSADDWTELVAALGEHGRAIALDMPDFGETIAATGFQHNVDAYAEFLAEALATLEIAHVHLVLHDFGGPFGLAWAAFQAITTRRAFRASISRGEPRGLPRAFVDRMYDHYGRRTKRAVLKLYRATDDPGGDSDLVQALAAREIPALVIWGEHDRYLPASYAARQREAFPSAEIHVLPASGHWPHADAPDTVERLLTEFLAPRLASAPPTPR
jgi:pimeloyl-ACP methyl ester carboxylesterase